MGKTKTIAEDWGQRTSSIRCDEICAALGHLGFSVRAGSRGGHKVVSHDGLFDFHGTNFNCGHGRNNFVKRSYVKTLLKILEQYEDELDLI